ncbi:NADH-quinone oxidoreductase subunit M, partial [bacterium]|nr:NADH-quinone oxidoreductase subunit M [bacterium]
FALFLLLETGMLGVFSALDFFLFYVFWEIMLLPMYFLIGIWGGPRREYAAIKFFLYTLFGSVFLFLAMIVIWIYADHSFDLVQLREQIAASELGSMAGIQWWLFLGMYVAFAIKIPAFPFHTWLPDAHVEAPTAISVILAGILLKMGIYGILRIAYPLLPDMAGQFALFIAIIALINIVYGALCAMAQTDLKKLVAYSSISHMGYVMLGMAALTPEGLNGAVLQMFNHGTITAMLFLLVGVVYDRAHHREIDGFGGLAQTMPIYSGITCLAFFASLGLPGLSGFISEALVFLGAFPVFTWITILAMSGIVITAAYVLWTYQRVFLGPLNEKYADMRDCTLREQVTLYPLAFIVILLGVFPHLILQFFEPTVAQLLEILK